MNHVTETYNCNFYFYNPFKSLMLVSGIKVLKLIFLKDISKVIE